MRPLILKSATAVYCLALFLQYQQYISWQQREQLEQVSNVAVVITAISVIGIKTPIAAVIAVAARLHSAPLPKWLYSYRILVAAFALLTFAFLSLVAAALFQRDSEVFAKILRFGLTPAILGVAAYILAVTASRRFYKPSGQATPIA